MKHGKWRKEEGHGRWNKAELDALYLGVSLHGEGNWKKILKDKRCGVLKHRTALMLKDKMRNEHKYKKNYFHNDNLLVENTLEYVEPVKLFQVS